MRKVERTARVLVEDEDGERHFIDEFTTFIEARMDGTSQWVKGSRRFSLNGEHCNPEGEDAFRALHSERLYRKV